MNVILFCAVILLPIVYSKDVVIASPLVDVNPLTVWQKVVSFNSTKCAEDIRGVIDDLNIGSFYALQMLDSCAKIPDGLLLGNHQFLGQYDQCMAAVSTERKFSGKYCLLGMAFPSVPTTPMVPLDPGALPYSYGTCVPSSCSVDDLNLAFQTYNDTVLFQASALTCATADQEVNLSVGDWFVVALLVILLLLAISSTIYELWEKYKNYNDKPHQLLTAFSLYKNGRAIFEVKYVDGHMDCLNGIRAITMCWVVLCHDAIFGMIAPVVNVIDVMQGAEKKSNVALFNGYLAVDTFFLLSGLLVAFVFFRDIGRSGSYDVPRNYLSRYIRLTPPYAMIILLQVTLIKYMGDGPIWNTLMKYQEDICAKYWWSGLLYIQNLVNPDEMCLTQTWYLSADMQLYILAPLFLYPLYLWPKWGPLYIGSLTVGAACLNFGIAVAYSLPYTPVLDQFGDENRLDNYPFWSRASPWLAGICLGYIIVGMKAKDIEVKLSPIIVTVGWIASSALSCSCLFGILWFLDNPDYTDAQAAAFLAFHRLGWAIGLAWVIFACIYGYGGPVNTFLSWGLFHPLAKLSFAAYLVHLSVLFCMMVSTRVSVYFNLATLSFSTMAAVIISNLAAIPLVLLVELPFGALDRYFLRPVKLFPYPKPRPKVRKQINLAPNVNTVSEGV